ncbi:MAG: xanthine dehydrogenase family protein molybdopterin-binding subunit [Proteobacteria bacterium]|nr:xanthine dehydrogenase family protein molybdopterin-binding subunit [Pseudomonadota bacterium]
MNGLTRRALLAKGSLVVAFASSGPTQAQESEESTSLPGDLDKYPFLDSWIRVDAADRITVFTGKVELGQGLRTALIQIAADELCVSPASIELITADTGRTPDEGVTAGSHSMQNSGMAILNAAANLRVLLTETAAWRLVTSVDQIELQDGSAYGPNGQHVGYGDLVAGFSLHVMAKPDVPRRSKGRRLIGESVPRVDIPAKVSGHAAYVQDIRAPGLLHARVVRGPSFGTQLKQADIDAVTHMPGIEQVVRNGRFIAILAAKEWDAVKASRRLQAAGWERRAAPLPSTDLCDTIRRSPARDIPIFDYPGPPAPADARIVKARYSRPCLMHGSIGPSCAVALWENGNMIVWTHSQGVSPLRKALAELLRLPLEKVRCIHVEGSGCYGHNGADDVAADAALAARAVPGRPVRLQWMREQEHGWEPLGSAMVVELQGALGRNGRIVGWRHDVWSNPHNGRPISAGGLLAGAELDPPFAPQRPRPIPMPEGGGDRNGNPIYAMPNARGVYHFVEQAPVRVSALRSLGAHMNVFAIESFMDEMAQAAGVDPVDFRLIHLQDSRGRAVVETAANRFGWKRRVNGRSGRGCGFGFARYKNLGAYCAIAMEIAVDPDTGGVEVRRAVAAVDSGEAVSPDGIRNQIEGAIVQSLSWTLLESVRFDTGGRTSFDWSAYPILRFPTAPTSIDVHLIDRPGEPFLGVGEAGQGPAAAALANAIADAIGHRLRDMPLTPERIRAALRS